MSPMVCYLCIYIFLLLGFFLVYLMLYMTRGLTFIWQKGTSPYDTLNATSNMTHWEAAARHCDTVARRKKILAQFSECGLAFLSQQSPLKTFLEVVKLWIFFKSIQIPFSTECRENYLVSVVQLNLVRSGVCSVGWTQSPPTKYY